MYVLRAASRAVKTKPLTGTALRPASTARTGKDVRELASEHEDESAQRGNGKHEQNAHAIADLIPVAIQHAMVHSVDQRRIGVQEIIVMYDDRKSGGKGQSVSVRVVLGGRSLIDKKKIAKKKK